MHGPPDASYRTHEIRTGVTVAAYPPVVVRSSVYVVEDQWSAVLDRGGVVDFFGSRLCIPTQRRFGDIDSVARYVNAVMDMPAVRSAFPNVGPVSVRLRRGSQRAHYEPDSRVIAIPMDAMWAGREAVVLHELAHHVAGSRGESGRTRWHGLHFRLAYCALVEIVLGPEAALLLRVGFEEAGFAMVEAQ